MQLIGIRPGREGWTGGKAKKWKEVESVVQDLEWKHVSGVKAVRFFQQAKTVWWSSSHAFGGIAKYVETARKWWQLCPDHVCTFLVPDIKLSRFKHAEGYICSKRIPTFLIARRGDLVRTFGDSMLANQASCLSSGLTDSWLLIAAYFTDKKCPWVGEVSIRGRILSGKVVSTKMTRTVVIRREYLHYVPKYNRYEKRHKNLAAHCSPAFRVEVGDLVTVGAYYRDGWTKLKRKRGEEALALCSKASDARQ